MAVTQILRVNETRSLMRISVTSMLLAFVSLIFNSDYMLIVRSQMSI